MDKKCFIIMPISDQEGYEKGHFSRVYKHLIKPACEKSRRSRSKKPYYSYKLTTPMFIEV
jgi:hypothetical protein